MKTKQSNCSYCGDAFESKKNHKGWSEYCKKSVKDRVWWKKGQGINRVVED